MGILSVIGLVFNRYVYVVTVNYACYVFLNAIENSVFLGGTLKLIFVKQLEFVIIAVQLKRDLSKSPNIIKTPCLFLRYNYNGMFV